MGEAVRVILFTCTEYEARNYGRFLRGVLTDLLAWHQDESQYLTDNRLKSNEKTWINPGMIKTWKADSSRHISVTDVVDWKTFRQFLSKWHKRICAVSHSDARVRIIADHPCRLSAGVCKRRSSCMCTTPSSS